MVVKEGQHHILCVHDVAVANCSCFSLSISLLLVVCAVPPIHTPDDCWAIREGPHEPLIALSWRMGEEGRVRLQELLTRSHIPGRTPSEPAPQEQRKGGTALKIFLVPPPIKESGSVKPFKITHP